LPLVGRLLRPAWERYDAGLLELGGFGWLIVLPGSGPAARSPVRDTPVRDTPVPASHVVVQL
jgi:hypothetical protein